EAPLLQPCRPQQQSSGADNVLLPWALPDTTHIPRACRQKTNLVSPSTSSFRRKSGVIPLSQSGAACAPSCRKGPAEPAAEPPPAGGSSPFATSRGRQSRDCGWI